MEHDLRQAPLFSGLTDAQLGRVVQRSATVRLDEGQWLFGQGDAAHRFYFVRSGQVRLFRLSADGGEKIIELIGPGQTFAEALMFMGTGRYPVCAAALAPTELVSIDAGDFAAMLGESPESCFALLGDLSKRLHALIAEIDNLTLHSAAGRVARWLLSQVPPERNELALEFTKATVASRLSIKPETWSRITRRLTERGIIAVNGHRIEVLDRAALQDIAEDIGGV